MAAAVLALAGCGQPPPAPTGSLSAVPTVPTVPTVSTLPPTPAGGLDPARVATVKSAFPAGFAVQAYPLKALGPHDIATTGVAAVVQTRVIPPQCRPAVIPAYAEPSIGTEASGVSGVGGAGAIHVLALRFPRPISVDPVPAGCGLGMVVSGSPEVAGPAELLRNLEVPGAHSTGAKLSPEDRNPVYVLTAALDERTSVVVTGSIGKTLDPQRVMTELLVKAVAAVRGG